MGVFRICLASISRQDGDIISPANADTLTRFNKKGTDMKWSSQEDNILRDNIHRTAREIADIIGVHRTRNSIIGRAHRLGLNIGGSVSTVKPPFKPSKVEHPTYTKTLRDVGENECRYTQDTGADMKVCGRAATKRGYCDNCFFIARIPNKKPSKKGVNGLT